MERPPGRSTPRATPGRLPRHPPLARKTTHPSCPTPRRRRRHLRRRKPLAPSLAPPNHPSQCTPRCAARGHDGGGRPLPHARVRAVRTSARGTARSFVHRHITPYHPSSRNCSFPETAACCKIGSVPPATYCSAGLTALSMQHHAIGFREVRCAAQATDRQVSPVSRPTAPHRVYFSPILLRPPLTHPKREHPVSPCDVGIRKAMASGPRNSHSTVR